MVLWGKSRLRTVIKVVMSRVDLDLIYLRTGTGAYTFVMHEGKYRSSMEFAVDGLFEVIVSEHGH